MNTDSKLSAPEARQLSGFLRTRAAIDDTLTFNQLKGYLFSICCTPEMLTPNFWLPPIFGSDESLPDLDDSSQVIIIDLLIKLYNQISSDVMDGNPKLPSNCKLDSITANNFKLGSGLHEWSWGFDYGLSLTTDFWDELPLETVELDEEIDSLWMMLSFFADEKRSRAAVVDAPTTPPFKQTLGTIRKQLPWLMKSYASISQMLYEAASGLPDDSDDAFMPSSPATLPSFDDMDENTPLAELIEAAYDADTHWEAIRLARKALQIEPNCVEAYLLLADYDAQNIQQRIGYLQQAVTAGEAFLGECYFKDNAGHFWGLVETRPYMQACTDLAVHLREAHKPQAAIELFEKSIHLNPNDNQGNRNLLLPLYLKQQQLEKAENLIQQYEDDRSAFMLFSEVLIRYIREGDTKNTRQLRKEANQYNKYVGKYLTGRIKLPKELPDYYGIGDKNEAIYYVKDSRELWRQVMGLIPWLMKK